MTWSVLRATLSRFEHFHPAVESDIQCSMIVAGKEVGMKTKNPNRTELCLASYLGLLEVHSPGVG